MTENKLEYGAGYGTSANGWAKNANYCLKSWLEFTTLTSQEEENIKKLCRLQWINSLKSAD